MVDSTGSVEPKPKCYKKMNEDVRNAKGLLINTYDPVTCLISGITNVELFLTDTPGL